MASTINTYALLQTAVANWLARDDLTARLPDFIAIAEDEIQRIVRRKTIRADLVVSTLATVLPATCAELRSAYPRTASPTRDLPLKISSPEVLAEQRAARTVSGRPVYGAVIDGTLLVAPTPDQAYTFETIYYEKLVPLDNATHTTNSILTENADIYLWGALKESAPYLQHDERIEIWENKFYKAVDQLNAAREREESNASIRPIRLPVVFG